jgi:UDP-N-acetylmuramoyl-L-alanyl-D-glutamate--2,6-diaminopimelate ligase
LKINTRHSCDFDFITNDTRQCTKNSAFLITSLSKKYLSDAKKKTTHIVYAKDLNQYISLDNIKIIGITGTNGKTTVSSIINFLFIKLKYKCALLGTRGFFINDILVEDTKNTTPDTLEIYNYIKKAIELKCEFFIMEVSSHAISQDRIAGINFETKIHTNITQDHLDFHKTIQEYRKIKNSFLKNSKNIIINKDDECVQYNTNAILYSLSQDGYLKVIDYTCDNEHTLATIEYNNEIVNLSSPLIGKFNLSNILASITTIKLSTNETLQNICKYLSKFSNIEGRMEIVNKNPLIIIDFAHTPDGMEQVFKIFNKQKIIVVFGAGGDRDKNKRKIMGKIASLYTSKIYLTNDNPRCENEVDIINNILEGINDKNKVNIIYNRKDAIQNAIQDIKKNIYDVLLIMGKGSEKYQEIYNKKIFFSDKDTVLKYINF